MSKLTKKQIETLVEVRQTGCASSHRNTVRSLCNRGLIIARPSNWGYTDYFLSPSGWAVFCGTPDARPSVDDIQYTTKASAALIAAYEEATAKMKAVPLDDNAAFNQACEDVRRAKRALCCAEGGAQ